MINKNKKHINSYQRFDKRKQQRDWCILWRGFSENPVPKVFRVFCWRKIVGSSNGEDMWFWLTGCWFESSPDNNTFIEKGVVAQRRSACLSNRRMWVRVPSAPQKKLARSPTGRGGKLGPCLVKVLPPIDGTGQHLECSSKGERVPYMHKVKGSSPFTPTTLILKSKRVRSSKM